SAPASASRAVSSLTSCFDRALRLCGESRVRVATPPLTSSNEHFTISQSPAALLSHVSNVHPGLVGHRVTAPSAPPSLRRESARCCRRTGGPRPPAGCVPGSPRLG